MKGKLLAVALPIALLTGCATTGTGQNQNATIGAVGGAVLGALVGGQMDNDGNRDRGRIVGALVGAAAGAGIGAYMDNQEAAMRAELEAERQRNAIEIERIKEDTLRLVLNDDVSFDFDSAAVKSSFYPSLNKMSQVLAKYGDTRITVVGHTDSKGSDSYNLGLSQRRAEAVKAFFVGQGISSGRISTLGKGEMEPRDSNQTAQGRSRNRRVEVLVQGINQA